MMSAGFDDLDRATLATLVREYLLCGHLIDRSGMPQVLAKLGLDGMTEVAIDEWMGASPIYTKRIQKLLGFEGSDVETIFKGMQLDIGAPPQFMDFRYRVIDANHGEFHLACCGALMDVEPMGEEFVLKMCHDIEDPTFDATAAATNPRARMRPVHRPPRVPADRTPHCLWTVTIDDDNEPLPYPEQATRMGTSRAARLPLPTVDDTDGRTEYGGPLEHDLALEAFSRGTLIALLDEIALQGHLLTLSYADAVERRTDAETMRDVVRKQFTGVAGVAAGRIAKALRTTDVARVVDLHPAFRPRSYIGIDVVDGAISLRDCPAIGDRPGRSWADVLADGATEPLDAIVHAVDPYAGVKKVRRDSWTIERRDDPREVPREVVLTRYSTGAEFVFEER
jgi:hypothetical protein